MRYWTVSVPNLITRSVYDGLVDIVLCGACSFAEGQAFSKLCRKGR